MKMTFAEKKSSQYIPRRQKKCIFISDSRNNCKSSHSGISNFGYSPQAQWKYFKQVESLDLLQYTIGTPGDKFQTPSTISEITERFDVVSFWFASKILMAGNTKQQSQLIEKLIRVLQVLLPKIYQI
jgi:hypothetical protein